MKTKRGFTLLEIVIVITVLGILTTVMIPIISNAIKNAKIENDKVLVDNINAILKADEPYNGRPASGDEVLWILSGNGLDVEDTNYENHAFYWSIDDNKVLIYNSEEENVLYPEELKEVEVTAEEVEEKVSSNEWFPIAGDYAYNELAYKITYYVNGKKIKFYGKTSYDGTIDKLELPMPNVYGAYSEGYEFNGWYINKDLTGDKINMIIINGSEEVNSGELVLEKLENLVFYSSFSKIPTAPDDYCTNNPNAEICQDNYCANNPDSEACGDPSKDPQDYCTENPNAEVCRDPVTSKTKYSIVYHTNGGTLNNPVTSYYGPLDETITLPIPTRYGYSFAGWYTTYNFVLGTRIDSIVGGSTGNKVLYALWTKDEIPVYSISYELNGGTLPNDAPTEYDGTEEIILPIATKEGYVFSGWYNNEDLTGEEITIIEIGSTEDKVFYAKWEIDWTARPADTYYITYELNGGTLYDPPTVIDGTKDFYLYTPLKRGYNFGGWYLTKDFSEETPIEVIPKEEQNQDYTVYAKWIAVEYNINYNLNGGSWENSNRVNYVYTIDRVVKYTQEVILEGYAFIGWFDNPECVGEPVIETSLGDTGEKTLYAKWDANKSNIYYHDSKDIIYKLDMESWPKTFTFEEEVILPVPEVAGYEFLGWYENEDLIGEPITKIEAGTMTSKIVYAKWELINYTINWVVNGGSWQDGSQPPMTYNVEDNTIDINDYIISKHYYDFNGWYEEEDFTGDIRTTIEKGTTGNITLYAKWEGILLEIPADFAGGTLQDRTIKTFAEELVNDFNTAASGYTDQVTDLVAFKKNSDKTVAYVWGNGNLEMIEKYQWFFEFAKEEITNVAVSNGYNNTYSSIYKSVVRMFDVLLAKPEDTYYSYKANALDKYQYQTDRPGVYTINGCNDTEGHNKTLFRSWIDGLINTGYYYAADIYRGCMVDYSNTDNLQRFNLAYTGNEISVITEKILPTPIKEGHIFLGWFDEENKKYETSVDVYDELERLNITEEEFKLYAKWEAINKYEIDFDLLGGHWENQTFDNFIEELIYYFKIPFKGDNKDNYYKETTKENFLKTSRPNITVVWYDAFALNKYLWLFDFLKGEIDTYAAAWDAQHGSKSYEPTRKILEYMTGRVNGKMKEGAINCFNSETNTTYGGVKIYNATTIDVLCEVIHCLINKRGPLTTSEKTALGISNTTYRSWIPDYSKPENIARFNSYYYSTDLEKNYYEGDTLPDPVREGYQFLGWFNDNGEHITTVTEKESVEALWEKRVSNDEQLAEAIGNLNKGNVSSIYVLPGEYSGDYIISKDWISIYSSNHNINPNTGERNAEAVFTGTITIQSSATGSLISGLAFTEDANIIVNGANQFKFLNNYFYDKSNIVSTPTYNKFIDDYKNLSTGGLIYITNASDLVFENNRFDYIDDINVHIKGINNITFDGNVFNNFGIDAIRLTGASTEYYNTGTIKFINNKFIRDTLGAYNGIFIQRYGNKVSGVTTEEIIISNNEFANIGTGTFSSFTGAIGAYHYNELPVTVTITNNIFQKCYNYIAFRNNATAAATHTTNTSLQGTVSNIWSCTVSNNQFIGDPTRYYFTSRDTDHNSDGEKNNPTVTIFGANYYEDNNGNVITTLDASKFGPII